MHAWEIYENNGGNLTMVMLDTDGRAAAAFDELQLLSTAEIMHMIGDADNWETNEWDGQAENPQALYASILEQNGPDGTVLVASGSTDGTAMLCIPQMGAAARKAFGLGEAV